MPDLCPECGAYWECSCWKAPKVLLDAGFTSADIARRMGELIIDDRLGEISRAIIRGGLIAEERDAGSWGLPGASSSQT